MGRAGYLGLGSNLGDRLANLQRAVDLLEREPGIRVTASSRVWETEPVGGPAGQPDYLNAVVRIETDLEARDLLTTCLKVEDALHRVRGERWGPRTIDIDILLMGDLVVADEDLQVPHPRMLERSFAVLPLLELDPDPVMPDGSRILDAPVGIGGVQPFAPPLEVSR